MKIIRIGQIETLKKYEVDIKKLAKYHIKKSKSRDTVGGIIETFIEGLNRPDKLNGIVMDNDKAIGFFISRLDTTFFANIDSNEKQPVIFIEHLYAPTTGGKAYVGKIYKGIREKFRNEMGAKNLFIFTHRNPEAWIKFSKDNHGVEFEIYGHILVDRTKED